MSEQLGIERERALRVDTLDDAIAIVQQSLDTVRAEAEANPESRAIYVSIAAREHVIALLMGYRGRVARGSDQREWK
jgi:hypothetical protein